MCAGNRGLVVLLVLSFLTVGARAYGQQSEARKRREREKEKEWDDRFKIIPWELNKPRVVPKLYFVAEWDTITGDFVGLITDSGRDTTKRHENWTNGNDVKDIKGRVIGLATSGIPKRGTQLGYDITGVATWLMVGMGDEKNFSAKWDYELVPDKLGAWYLKAAEGELAGWYLSFEHGEEMKEIPGKQAKYTRWRAVLTKEPGDMSMLSKKAIILNP